MNNPINDDLRALQPELEQQVAAALTRRARSNRGTFPPFRIPGAAKTLVAGLLEHAGRQRDGAGLSIGETFGQQGLGLAGLLEAQAAAIELVVGRFGTTAEPIRLVSQYFGQVVDSFVQTEQAEANRQRAEMERAYTSTVTEQYQQQEELRSTIRELSTPIIPVYEGILVLPLVGSIDSRRATEITERLLEGIATQQAEMVIIDITGVPVIDTSTANHLLMTTRAAALLGSKVILVGIGADIAQTMIHIGIELHGLITLANLQDGIAYALGQLGLGIQPLKGRVNDGHEPAPARR
jgi:rsbT co-antagonist protein RsbR